MTRVSIITPFLNAGPFIEESIRSVLAQTYDNWELLLVDDGSTDASTGIALKYAADHPDKVRYVSHERRQNRGASASRNLAARHARGEYLAFLDADDVYLPRKLEVKVPILDAQPDVAMLYAATEYWYSWTGRRDDAGRDWVWRKYGAEPDTVIEPPRMLVRFLEDGGTVPCMGGVLVRRAAVERVGGWEESFRRICTDQAFHAKLCLNFPVMIVDVCLDRYRQHENSSCRTVARAGQLDAAVERYLTWLESYLSAQPVVDPTVRAAARQALRRHRHPWLHRVQRQALRYNARIRRLASRTDRSNAAATAASRPRAMTPLAFARQHPPMGEHGVVKTSTPAALVQPRVCVVIPCYNGGRFLGEAIESVLRQTYPAAEIVVVDDGSTDDTVAVARSYEGIQCIEQRNQGAPAARNRGMRSSTADLLVFLDADDRLQPHALATGVESLQANPEWAFVSGDVRVIAEDGSPRHVPEQRPRSGDPYIQLLRSNYIWTPGVVMYRRESLRAVNGFDTSAGASADYDLNVRIARRFPVGRHYQVILDYRQHPSSMSSNVRYMLKSAVTVRRAERRHACRSAEGKRAWREGIAIVQADYGGRLITQMKSDLCVAGRRGRAVISAWYLVRYYPAGIVRLAGNVFRRAAARPR